MVQKILVALARRTSYSLAVTLLSVAGGQAAAVVGFLFIIVTVDLSATGTPAFLLIMFLGLVGAAASVHYLLYGLAAVFNKSWGLAWLRPLNENMDGMEFRREVPPKAWAAINKALERIPFSSTKLAGILSLSVVAIFMAITYTASGSINACLGVLRGGLIATALYLIFSFSIIELLTGPARGEARRRMIVLGQGPLPRASSHLTVKLGFFPVLILISIIISHSLITGSGTAFSGLVMACFGAAMLVLGLAVMGLVFLSIIKPLKEINESAALLSTANQAEFKTGSLDREFISMATGFYEYAQKIVGYRRELHNLNQSLERRVSERTRELSRANEALEQKIEYARLAELALRVSEEKYRTLIEKMQDAVFLLHEGGFVFTNQAFGQMVGYSAEELSKMSFEDVVAPEDREVVDGYRRRRLEGRETPDLQELLLLHRNGKTRLPVLMSVGMINSAEGAAYSLGTIKDITALKEAEADRQKRARLEGIMAMAGGACHELNQPLQGAYAQCELAMMQIGESHPLYKRFAAILQELNRLGDLTKKIQRITRDEITGYLGRSNIIDINKASEGE